jgi:hypothetical protein
MPDELDRNRVRRSETPQAMPSPYEPSHDAITPLNCCTFQAES